jgi:hypothetical protein
VALVNDLVAFFNLDFSKWSSPLKQLFSLYFLYLQENSIHWVIRNATWLFQNQEAFDRELSLAVPPPSDDWEFVFALTIHNSLGEVAPLFACARDFMSSPDANVDPTLFPPLAESAFANILKARIQLPGSMWAYDSPQNMLWVLKFWLIAWCSADQGRVACKFQGGILQWCWNLE